MTDKLDFAVTRICQDGNQITRIETGEIKPELPSDIPPITYYISRIEFKKIQSSAYKKNESLGDSLNV